VPSFGAGRPIWAPPGGLVLVEQRCHCGGGEEPHDLHHNRGECLAHPLVAAALHRVLDFQCELRTQPVQPDRFVLGDHAVAETHCELVDVRSPMDLPGLRVRMTERQRRMRPQRAVIDPAGQAAGRLFDRPIRQPPVRVRSSRSPPLLTV